MGPGHILGVKFQSQDLGQTTTVKKFLIELLRTLWIEEEGFSGKRPFGNSGWKCDVARALVVSKMIPGQVDEEEGELIDYDESALDELILKAIRSL